MKLKNLLLAAGTVGPLLFWACAKNATPAPPVHDTVTVHKTDTLVKRDTLFKPVDTPNLKIGLLLYLPFNGSIADSSGNANPTTLIGSGSVLTYDAHGYANSAFGGTGSGQRIKVTNNGSIKFDTAFSVSFDFMINAPARQSFVAMLNTTTGSGPAFLASASIPGFQNLDLYTNDISAGCADPGALSAVAITDTASVIPQPGSWYNMICTYRKGAIQVFVNGRLAGSKKGAGTAAMLCPDAQVVVGGWWDGDPISLNGKLDEVRLYNRVLSDKDIAWLSRNFQVTSTKIRSTPVTRP